MVLHPAILPDGVIEEVTSSPGAACTPFSIMKNWTVCILPGRAIGGTSTFAYADTLIRQSLPRLVVSSPISIF
jgi:hypothetical protein